jgi:hypothetical protein
VAPAFTAAPRRFATRSRTDRPAHRATAARCNASKDRVPHLPRSGRRPRPVPRSSPTANRAALRSFRRVTRSRRARTAFAHWCRAARAAPDDFFCR